MSSETQKALDALIELGRVLANAGEDLRIAERLAGHVPGDWTLTIREIATYTENTNYALDQQMLELLEGES